MSAISQLLTEHLDIWTAADTGPRSGRGRSSGNAASVYGVKKLRELILELAVRGKLVPQDAEDEPASELLKRIQAEKEKLVAEGTIKKDKPLLKIAEEEKPFKLPSEWEWVRLPEIYYPISVSANKLLSSEINEKGIFPVIDQGQRYIAGYTDNDELLISLPGPVVIFGDHTTERKFVDFDFVAGADGVKILRPLLQDERFFWWQLVGIKLENRGYARHYSILNESFYAVPPLEEQHRIVAKVDELMALCDQLESEHNNASAAHEQLVSQLLAALTQAPDAEAFSENWQRIATHFDTLFTTEASINTLKQTLLQLAVMGKLVPQDPSDEPASELIKRIQTEKAKLIAKGKIKKEKLLPPISDNEKPSELPQGWESVRLSDITSIRGGSTPSMSKSEYWGGKVLWISPKDMHDGAIVNSELKVTDKALNETGLELVPVGSILIVGRSGILKRKLPAQITAVPCTINQDIKAVTPIKPLSDRYMQLIFWGNEKEILVRDVKQGTTVQSLVYESLFSRPFSFPPAAEQNRIVAKVDELMALCDQLKSRLTEASQLQQKLADVLVENAVSANSPVVHAAAI